MAEIKWIKITTNMFDDEKIRLIQNMPEGDAVLVIWIRLLTLAGKTNNGGYIYLAEQMPYTEEMLSHLFDKPLPVIRLALETFKMFQMVEIDERGIYLANWEKHQNIEGMERIKEQAKQRKMRFKERQQQGLLEERSGNVPERKSNATELELELDKDKERDKKKKLTPKTRYADFVSLKESEYQKLVDKHGEELTKRMIEILDNYKGSTGKKYKDDYRTILNWVVKRVEEEEAQVKPTLRKQQGQDKPIDPKFDLLYWGQFGGGGN